MKAKVIMPFKDKNNGKTYNIGDVISCTDERMAEVKKYVAVINEPKPAKKEETE